MPGKICIRTLRDLCRHYSEYGVRGQIIDLVPTRPEMEFPEALRWSGSLSCTSGLPTAEKTFHALERLREAEHGVYLGPLRLLALEVYEKMKDFGLACTMLTGEECIREDGSRVVSSTLRCWTSTRRMMWQ